MSWLRLAEKAEDTFRLRFQRRLCYIRRIFMRDPALHAGSRMEFTRHVGKMLSAADCSQGDASMFFLQKRIITLRLTLRKNVAGEMFGIGIWMFTA